MRYVALLTTFVLLIFSGQCSAEVRTFHAESSYPMDRSEPIKIAQENVFNDAVKKISEKAGVVVESLSKSKDSALELDRVETFTAAVLRIKSKTFGKNFTDNGDLTITVAVDAELDTAVAEELLNELRQAKATDKNYETVLKEYTAHKSNFDTVYGEWLASYQTRIIRTIRQGCKLENDGKFDDALKSFDAAIVESIANNAEISLAYVKRGFVNFNLKNLDAAAKDFKRAIEIDNDATGLHLAKAMRLESQGNKIQATQEYRAFVKDADIIYYDVEITFALDKIVTLEAN